MLEIKITNEPVKLSDFLLTANPFIEKGFPVRRKSESFRGSIVILISCVKGARLGSLGLACSAIECGVGVVDSRARRKSVPRLVCC